MENEANWADHVKFTKAFFWTKPFHFINTPDFQCSFNPVKDCSNACLYSALENYTAILSNSSSMEQGNNESTTDAIRFLVHFVGDLHQPLHVGFGSDFGGNKLLGTIDTGIGIVRHNLHAIWDEVLIDYHIKKSFNNDYESFKSHLNSRLNSEFKGEISAWTKCSLKSSKTDCFAEWASEAAKADCDYVYTDDSGNRIGSDFTLGQTYFEKNALNAETLLIKAGVRLAFVLNSAVETAIKGYSITTI
jgi:hypothetical protein